MKSELKVCAHKAIPGHLVVEIWHDGKFVGTVAGADGPGVRVLSRHPLTAVTEDGGDPNVMNIKIG